MTDNITKKERSEVMKKVKSVSKLETMVSKELWGKGYRFRRNVKALFGYPYISIKKYQLVIFIDSCFWHQCPLHRRMPKSNKDFWIKKLNRNVERDKEVTEYYLERGWNIKRIWEHEIKQDFENIIKEISKFIDEVKKRKAKQIDAVIDASILCLYNYFKKLDRSWLDGNEILFSR